MEYVLRTKNLTKAFSSELVVNSVNMNIRKGDIYGFIGKNGAGKTTLMRTIVGLAVPTSGEIELFESKDLDSQRSKIGTIIESPALYPTYTAKQNLIVQQKLLLGKVDLKEIDEILKMVGLDDVGNKKAKKFSLGMKQRLAIAIALIGKPEFLILDEPINGLDPTGIKEIRNLILLLNKEHGITVLISSHILGELSKVVTCYGVIRNGKLIDEFDAKSLRERVQAYLEIKVDSTELAGKIIEENLNTKNYEILENDTIHLYDNIDESSKINSLLVQNGVTVYSISNFGENYEDYFIKLMEGQKDD